VLNHLLDCDQERNSLNEELEKLLDEDEEVEKTEAEEAAEAERINEITDRLDFIDADNAESKAKDIITGVGFQESDFDRPCKDFSGGWRMRIAIAKILYCKPEILMLDEPTNHLDLPALIWLENYLVNLEDTTVIIVSHARDFLDAICTKMIHLQGKKLTYWSGNFSQFKKNKDEQDKIQTSARVKEDKDIAKLKEFIAVHGATDSSAASSKQKVIDNILANRTEEVLVDPDVVFKFPVPETKVPTPCMRL